MSTSNKLKAIERLIGKNGFALMNTDNVVKLEPVISVNDFISTVEDLVEKGDLNSI